MLKKQRQEIDRIDQEIIRLLEARLDVVSEVVGIKEQEKIEVLDSEREKSVLDKVEGAVKNKEYASTIKALYQEMMRVSKEYQSSKLIKKSDEL
ncbi:chorismate mutase [Vagococcus sp. PNs007]|uniref:Chorismate mutase n=1 Tax=Vagococcus proximus TaxID=2991417 RepID=A0ABT5X4F3_9ENTE|nr:chorismate mutase [Vagococcus proximus]MDF0480761.1 chorismate mutase [Vagococcus proximus]